MKIRIFTLILALLMLALPLAACKPAEENPGDTPAPERKLTVDLDLTAEWNKVAADGSLVQGCVVVRKEFLEEHPNAVAEFLSAYKSSIDFLNESTEQAAQMVVDQGIFNSAPVVKKAVPKSNVRYVDGEAMKSAMQTYLSVLHSINPASIGNALPADDFYYVPTDSGNGAASEDLSDLTVKVYTLNGTTGFGMAKLMNDAKAGNTALGYEFTVKTEAAAGLSAVINGDADIAALPTNAAANVYNKTGGKVSVLAINTLGCLYLMNNTGVAVNSMADLKGKTVYVPAQNPTFIFTYLCKQNGLVIGTDITIDSTTYSTPALLRDAVAAGEVDYAVLPEPMVTIAQNAAANAGK
jgi:ABC-type nitrate/sulfonate/bicarbonate transport system substrate-binding protein